MNVLIIYASIEGQTAKIAHFMESELEKAGHSVRMVDAQGTDTLALDDVDKVILAAPVHERRHPQLFETLLIARKKTLETRDTLLVSVSLSAAFPEGVEEAGEYVTELKMRTGFEPTAELLVAGAIRTGHYDYFATQVLRHVVLRDRNYDPSSEEHEFTDWKALSAALESFMADEKALT
jgi:menaquinone-dependent protoporphyrinogen oxidase